MGGQVGAPHKGRVEIANYLRAQSPPLKRASDAQTQWSKHLAPLFSGAQEGKGAVTAARARALGKTYGPVFKECLALAEKVEPPAPAIRCQEYMVRWLKALINATDTLMHAPEDGQDMTYLRDCHDFLEDARYAVKPLTEIRQKLYEAAKGPPAQK